MPGDDSAYIVCVADNPRIHYCGDNSLFDPQTLSCLNYEVTSQNLARFWFDPLFTAWASDCPPWSCCPLPVQSLWKIGCSLGQFTFFYNLFKLIYSNSALVFVELPNRTFVRLLLFLFLWSRFQLGLTRDENLKEGFLIQGDIWCCSTSKITKNWKVNLWLKGDTRSS